jgi:hypothetical protein
MIESDKDIDAAWRVASREEPPQALDDAIRAAARREVGSGPRRPRGTPAWWPLAAAATVAFVAIGIVEMTPPERVSPGVAVDMRSAPVAKQSTPEPAPAQKPTSAESERNVPGAAPVEKAAGLQIPESALRKESPVAGHPEDQLHAASRERADTQRRAPAGRGLAIPPEREPKQKSERANAAAAPATRPDASAIAPSRSVPFPAASTPRDRLDAQAQAPVRAPPVPAEESRPAALAKSSSPAAQASAPAADAFAPPAPAAAEKRMAMAKTATGEIQREADAPPRTPDEWIKRMRRLIAEGKRVDAAKELASFRTAYKERADALLPADLREFKP